MLKCAHFVQRTSRQTNQQIRSAKADARTDKQLLQANIKFTTKARAMVMERVKHTRTSSHRERLAHTNAHTEQAKERENENNNKRGAKLKTDERTNE